MTRRITIISALLLLGISASVMGQTLNDWVADNCVDCPGLMAEKTGTYILEKGEEALMGRAWLTQHAQQSIDIQYFIWSTDNIGILAAQLLLEAANRGVVVRVLVDDFLIDAQDYRRTRPNAIAAVRARECAYPNLQPEVLRWDVASRHDVERNYGFPRHEPAHARQDGHFR
jgi:phosphatidylserine/phosphatidylglycerophosphate/cardiolipin synthase-like enzyme